MKVYIMPDLLDEEYVILHAALQGFHADLAGSQEQVQHGLLNDNLTNEKKEELENALKEIDHVDQVYQKLIARLPELENTEG